MGIEGLLLQRDDTPEQKTHGLANPSENKRHNTSIWQKTFITCRKEENTSCCLPKGNTMSNISGLVCLASQILQEDKYSHIILTRVLRGLRKWKQTLLYWVLTAISEFIKFDKIPGWSVYSWSFFSGFVSTQCKQNKYLYIKHGIEMKCWLCAFPRHVYFITITNKRNPA